MKEAECGGPREAGGGRKLIIAPDGSAPAPAKFERDETMIRALVKAQRWRPAGRSLGEGGRRIESGQAKSITDLAAQEGVTDAYVCRPRPKDQAFQFLIRKATKGEGNARDNLWPRQRPSDSSRCYANCHSRDPAVTRVSVGDHAFASLGYRHGAQSSPSHGSRN